MFAWDNAKNGYQLTGISDAPHIADFDNYTRRNHEARPRNA